MDICCEEKLQKKQDEVDNAFMAYQKIVKSIKERKIKEIKNKSIKFGQFKTKVSDIVDNSFGVNSTTISKIFGVISIIFILLSTVSLILGSIPFIQNMELTYQVNLFFFIS